MSTSYNSSAASSRRQSMMLPPAIPIAGASHGGAGSALNSPGMGGASLGSDAGVGPGPGPQRHPRPLTAAELHMQLEREQEAVVNRLTRELAALRAQQSHGTSSSFEDTFPITAGSSPVLHHTYHPRHHRTGSNTSISAISNATNNTAGGVAGSLSRQNSTRSIRSVNTGGRSSPAVGDLLPLPPHSTGGNGAAMTPPIGGTPGSYPYGGYYGYQYQGGLGLSTTSTNGSETHLPLSGGGSVEIKPASLVETMAWKNELENVKRENEALKKKIRELEKTLKEAAGVEPEGWGGGAGSVSGVSVTSGRGPRSRSSSMSFRERGRRERRTGEESLKAGQVMSSPSPVGEEAAKSEAVVPTPQPAGEPDK